MILMKYFMTGVRGESIGTRKKDGRSNDSGLLMIDLSNDYIDPIIARS